MGDDLKNLSGNITSVTIEKDHGGVLSKVTIDLSISGSEFGIRNHNVSIVSNLNPLPECAESFRTTKDFHRACLVMANEGIISTSRGFRDSCGQIILLRLQGERLPARGPYAFEIAASIALVRALKRTEPLPRNMDGWTVVD